MTRDMESFFVEVGDRGLKSGVRLRDPSGTGFRRATDLQRRPGESRSEFAARVRGAFRGEQLARGFLPTRERTGLFVEATDEGVGETVFVREKGRFRPTSSRVSFRRADPSPPVSSVSASREDSFFRIPDVDLNQAIAVRDRPLPLFTQRDVLESGRAGESVSVRTMRDFFILPDSSITGVDESLVSRVRRESATLEQRNLLTSGRDRGLSSLALGSGAFALGFATPFVQVATDPVGFGRGVVTSFADPVGTVRQVATGLRQTPFQTGGELVGTRQVFRTGGSLIRGAANAVQFTGKPFIPAERIVSRPVLDFFESGGVRGTRFPNFRGSPRGLQNQFNIPNPSLESITGGRPAAFSGTRGFFSANTVARAGTSETAGLFTSPSTMLSPNFLRLNIGSIADSLTSDLTLLPKFGRRQALLVRGRTERAPPSVRRGSFEDLNRFVEQAQAGSGRSFISPAFEKGLKPEAEAVVTQGSSLQQVRGWNLLSVLLGRNFDAFTRIAGTNIPIKVFDRFPNSGRVLGGGSSFERAVASSSRVTGSPSLVGIVGRSASSGLSSSNSFSSASGLSGLGSSAFSGVVSSGRSASSGLSSSNSFSSASGLSGLGSSAFSGVVSSGRSASSGFDFSSLIGSPDRSASSGFDFSSLIGSPDRSPPRSPPSRGRSGGGSSSGNFTFLNPIITPFEQRRPRKNKEDKRKSKKREFGLGFSFTGFLPSVTASVFNIRGRRNKPLEVAGLSIRPIQL